jgi:protein gp37
MGETTSISWCDKTFNGWLGCMKVSPACDGCYAEALMDKRYGRVQWGAPGHGPGTRVRTSGSNWQQPIRWNKKAAAEGTRPFVFCSSLADVFDNQVSHQWRRDLFDLIRSTPNLVWLLLTKRPQLIGRLYEEAQRINDGGTRWTSDLPRERAMWPRNAAIGTTVEDQDRAINLFRLAAAARDLKPLFTFASFEPLLGPVDPTRIVVHEGGATFYNDPEIEHASILFNALLGAPSLKLPPLGWAITGGETDQGGHKARPTHPDWFRSLRDQCAAASVAYHHKQNGEWLHEDQSGHVWLPSERSIRGIHPWPDETASALIGKNRTGRLLDGVEHNARPQVAA